MAVDEVRVRLRRKLEEAFGVEEAAFLIDTRDNLDLKFEAFEHRLTAAMEVGFRAQTWRLITALIAAMGVQTAVMATLISVAQF